MTNKRKNKRNISPHSEKRFIALRGGFSRTFFLNEVLDQQLLVHLEDEFGNNAQKLALLKLTGRLEAMKRNMKWLATKEDMTRWFHLAEQLRWDRKGMGLTKQDAMARFLTGKPLSKVSRTRPGSFQAKPGTPYTPKPGSSKGKIITKMTGFVRVQKMVDKMMRQIFMLGDGKKAKQPKMDIARTISKTYNIK